MANEWMIESTSESGFAFFEHHSGDSKEHISDLFDLLEPVMALEKICQFSISDSEIDELATVTDLTKYVTDHTQITEAEADENFDKYFEERRQKEAAFAQRNPPSAANRVDLDDF